MRFSRANEPYPPLGTISGTEEGRAFLQARIGTFAWYVFVLSGGTWGLFALIGALSPNTAEEVATHLLSPGDILHLVGALTAGVLYVGMRGRSFRARSLHTLDVAASLSIIALLTTATAMQSEGDDALLAALLSFNATLLARAIIVPSTARRTLFIGVVLGGAIIAVTVFEVNRNAAGLRHLFSAICWVGVGVTLSTLASRTIFGLRRAVHQAMVMGQYTLEEKIGAGGMGEVWRARHAFLRRPTAVKLIAPNRGHGEALQRFEREVQLTAQLTHPSTVAIYDYGQTREGVFYYAMELVDGMDLERLVRAHGPLSPERVVHLLIQICGALAEAHDRGLVHRDVKPANVLLSPRDGEHEIAKIVDFGLVKCITPAAQAPDVAVTSTNAFVGTPLYTSPEAICTPDAVDARSDLYSLGALAWFLLTGRPPFEGNTIVEVCTHHLYAEPLSPSATMGHSICEDLERVVMRCLSKKPDDRPASARELRGLLERCSAAGQWSKEQAQTWWREPRDGRAAALEGPSHCLDSHFGKLDWRLAGG